ncbi:post-GPI attachment to proteins factor 3 isoform X2 [Capsella rubella]|uniref:post-GPI attachment to proteins factor 3 isoform X2 n=1 Tax=Capsella rubella TaxID=81985 RepID=UPI000CD54107|nr:post-GPI attachment to proteins factor 3 isoform X2 [Capsella rubella]
MVVHGTSKNLCIYNGKNWVVKVIAVISVWLIERENVKLLVKPRSNTMVNGPSNVYLGFRFEPASVAFSVLNLAMHFHGWLSFFITLYYKLPLKQDRTAYYEYVGLWHLYGLLSMNSWFWSAVFHSRDVDLTERLDYSSAVAVLGFSLIVAILRTFDVRVEAARVMVSAPILAFVTTHILYINFYKLDYGWNMIVCVAMGVSQLLLWARWAAVSSHPSNWKLWVVVIAGGLAMLLEIYDFPPYEGYFDAHSIWHAATIPLTILWWSFIRDDAEFRTSSLLKKSKTKAK